MPPTMPPTRGPFESVLREPDPTAAPTPVTVGWLGVALLVDEVAESDENVDVGVIDVNELKMAVDSGTPGRMGMRIKMNCRSFDTAEGWDSPAAATSRAAVSLNLSAFCVTVSKRDYGTGTEELKMVGLPQRRDTPMLEPPFQVVSPPGI